MSNEYRELFDSLDEDNYLEKFIILISRILYDRDSFVKNSDNSIARDEFYRELHDKIIEIYEDYKERSGDNTSLSKCVELIGSGHSSLAFKIGDRVLKVSKTDYNYRYDKFRDFKCLIPLLFEKSVKVSDREYYSMQVSPFVDTKDIIEEDVYSSYKSLRDLGYIWNDPKEENTGRIISDFDYNGISYKAGDLVIIDLEDLAYVGEETSDTVLEEIAISSYNGKTYTYEVRYMKEKGKTL